MGWGCLGKVGSFVSAAGSTVYTAGVRAWDYGSRPILPGGFSVLGAAITAGAAAASYCTWGASLGQTLAGQYNVNPPADRVFEAAGGSFAALAATLSLTFAKNVATGIWNAPLRRPSARQVVNFLGLSLLVTQAAAVQLLAFPALILLLMQQKIEVDDDDALGRDVHHLELYCKLFLGLSGYFAAALVNKLMGSGSGSEDADSKLINSYPSGGTAYAATPTVGSAVSGVAASFFGGLKAGAQKLCCPFKSGYHEISGGRPLSP